MTDVTTDVLHTKLRGLTLEFKLFPASMCLFVECSTVRISILITDLSSAILKQQKPLWLNAINVFQDTIKKLLFEASILYQVSIYSVFTGKPG